ncbi:MAG: hypothetical protein A2Z29_00465 [Chloroflexi bacterium RBG_16_56_11]|nr:MAG: hypothetical protein A2Z29_00465 [Chloroflexi bacterium RBG_16_56_11]
MDVLTDYRVIDLTDEKGMFCAKILADMGAGVTRINVEKGEDRARFHDLVKTADVIVESHAPGYLVSLGLGYDKFGAINPGLIMASITPFGQSGPYRDFYSSDLVAQALGGWMSVTGLPDSPLKLPGDQSYRIASLFAVNGILLALWQRHATGRGQYIDISIMECVTATLDHVLVRYFYEGIVSGRKGSLHWNGAFRVFRCKDGYVLLSLFRQWETLVEWLGSEDMAGDLANPRWRDREERMRGLDHIIEVLERWTLVHTTAEIVENGQLMHFPWAVVVRPPDLPGVPQMVARRFFTETEYGGRKYRAPGSPLRMESIG